jgi:hypothetical protein
MDSALAKWPLPVRRVMVAKMTDRLGNILLCSCEGTMRVDSEGVRRGCHGAHVAAAAHQLCRKELGHFQAIAKDPTPLTVGCTQEAASFAAAAAQVGRTAPLHFVNLRETAGWSSDAAAAGPKMAALLAAAAEPMPDPPCIALKSGGVVLIYGRDEQAVEAGNLLKAHLDVTVLIKPPAGVAPPRINEFPVAKGTIRSARGYLGAFEITVDDFAQAAPSSRGALSFGTSRHGAVSRCDVVLDLSGGHSLFPAADLRDGYLRADPGDPAAVLRAVLKARDLGGTFDKPRYITFSEQLCAHSRHCPGGRSCRHRREYMRRVRPMCCRLSHGSCHLRAAAARCIDAQIARVVGNVSRGRWGARRGAAA